MQHVVDTVRRELEQLRQRKDRVIVAIDGRCASGKTTLASELGTLLSGSVFHMDDFFLRQEQRTVQRYEEPGGNVDRERFLEEVLSPLARGSSFSYRPFDCHTMKLREPVQVVPAAFSIVEGTYSCHPALWNCYDLRIFLSVAPDTQFERIERRNGAASKVFRERWIPLEEKYFAAFGIEERCDLRFET